VSRFKTYWVWIDGKPGVPPHKLHDNIARDGLMLGRSTQTWSTALAHLRDYMKKGYIVRVYEVDDGA
jgi:hypothetical protein